MRFRFGTSAVLAVAALVGAALLSDYHYAQAVWLLAASTIIFGLWWFVP